MVVFALTLLICSEPSFCAWVRVEEFTSEVECIANGQEWTAEGGEIIAWKCVAVIRGDVPTHPYLRDRG
jgi:hypothetical protein